MIRQRHHRTRRLVRHEGRRDLQAVASGVGGAHDERRDAAIELTDNVLWLLKQAFYFSLTTVNDAVIDMG